MKTYIKKKINEILRIRAIKAEWRKNIQKEMQIFFNQFEKIIDEEFKKNINTLINFLNEGKSFDDLIDINFIKNEGKFIVYNNFSTTTLSINPKFKCLEIKKYSFPKGELPKFIVWLSAPIGGIERKFVSNNAGYPIHLDNAKSVRELGIKYRPLKESLLEFFQSLIDNKMVQGEMI